MANTDDLATDFSAVVKDIFKPLVLPTSNLLHPPHHIGLLGHTERLLVQSSIDILDNALGNVQSTLQEVPKLADLLRTRSQELETELFLHKSLLAPIRRLPSELLQHIFGYVAATNAKWGAPPTVARVSKHWRQLALATPELWATTMLLLPCSEPASAQYELFRYMAERSGDHPVSLRIEPHFGWEQVEWVHRPQANSLAETLSMYSHRLGSIVISHSQAPTDHLLRLLDGFGSSFNLPNLVSFALHSHTLRPEEMLLPGDAPFAFLSRSAPNLQRVAFGGYDDLHDCFVVPWGSLRAFTGVVSAEKLITLFHSWKTLELIDVLSYGIPSSPETTLLPLASLHSLCLQLSEFPQSPDHLPPLPALRHLIVQPNHLQETPFGHTKAASVVSAISKWGTNLLYLCLDVPSLATSWKSVNQIVSKTPNLEALSLPAMAFTQLDHFAQLLPRLSHVELIEDDPLYYVNNELQVVAERCPRDVAQRLRTVTMIYIASLAPEDINAPSSPPWMTGLRDVFSKLGMKGVVSAYDKSSGIHFGTPYFSQKGGFFSQYASDFLLNRIH